jgi:argininosuccinate lyase
MKALLHGSDFTTPAPSAGTAALPLAERLVLRGVPFREAHRIVGELVSRLELESRSLAEATIDDLTAVDERFDPSDLAVLDLDPAPIDDQISALRGLLSN